MCFARTLQVLLNLGAQPLISDTSVLVRCKPSCLMVCVSAVCCSSSRLLACFRGSMQHLSRPFAASLYVKEHARSTLRGAPLGQTTTIEALEPCTPQRRCNSAAASGDRGYGPDGGLLLGKVAAWVVQASRAGSRFEHSGRV